MDSRALLWLDAPLAHDVSSATPLSAFDHNASQSPTCWQNDAWRFASIRERIAMSLGQSDPAAQCAAGSPRSICGVGFYYWQRGAPLLSDVASGLPVLIATAHSAGEASCVCVTVADHQPPAPVAIVGVFTPFDTWNFRLATVAV